MHSFSKASLVGKETFLRSKHEGCETTADADSFGLRNSHSQDRQQLTLMSELGAQLTDKYYIHRTMPGRHSG